MPCLVRNKNGGPEASAERGLTEHTGYFVWGCKMVINHLSIRHQSVFQQNPPPSQQTRSSVERQGAVLRSSSVRARDPPYYASILIASLKHRAFF